MDTVLCFYSPVTAGINDQNIFKELADILATYHWELDEGDFVVVAPNHDYQQNIGNAIQVPIERRIYVVTHLEEITSDPILVLDTMLRTAVSPTLFGGYQITQKYASQQNSQRYVARSRGVAHRMCTKSFFFQLPLVDNAIGDSRMFVGDKIQLGISLQQVLSMWNGDKFPMVSLLSLLERFRPDLLVFPLAQKQETDNAYQLITEGFTKSQHLPFAGRDHVETLLNLWEDLLHYLSVDGGRTININMLIDSNRVGSWCQVRSINIEPMMAICTLVLSTMQLISKDAVIDLNTFRASKIHDDAYPLLASVFQDRILYRKDDSIHPAYSLQEHNGINFVVGSSLMVSFLENSRPPLILGLVLDRNVDNSTSEIIIGMIDGNPMIEVDFHDTLNNPPKLSIEPLIEDESTGEPY